MINHAFTSVSQVPLPKSFKGQKVCASRLTYDADKGLKVYGDYGNVHTEVFARLWTTATQFWNHLDGSFSRDPHGDKYPWTLHHIAGTVPPFPPLWLLSWSLVCTLPTCQLLLYITPLLRGWWSHTPCLWRQTLKPGLAFHNWPETTSPGLTPSVTFNGCLINTVPTVKMNWVASYGPL